jgi:hypothetical protein
MNEQLAISNWQLAKTIRSAAGIWVLLIADCYLLIAANAAKGFSG